MNKMMGFVWLVIKKFGECHKNYAKKNNTRARPNDVVKIDSYFSPTNKGKAYGNCTKCNRYILPIFIIEKLFHWCLCLNSCIKPIVTNGVSPIKTTNIKIPKPNVSAGIKSKVKSSFSNSIFKICKHILQKICICKIQVLCSAMIASTCISHISFADANLRNDASHTRFADVKLDAELFAKSVLIDGQALSAKTQASSVPGFKTDNPDATKYYSDSSTMEAKSISAKAGDTSSVLIQDSYNKKKEFKDDALKTMLDSKSISSNPKRTIETIASQYNKCEDTTSANKQKYETKRCDEYISTSGTSTGGTSCYIGNLIGLNSDTNYTCTKEKEVYKKVVTSNLNASCKTKQSQFFETTYQNFQGFNVSGNTLYLGLNTGGSTLGQNCSGYNFSWKFKVENLADVKTLYWNSLILDDSIRVYVNGQAVWSWGNACEMWARRGFNPNVDFKPYLKHGDNEIIFQVIVGGGGSFHSTLTWDYSKPRKSR